MKLLLILISLVGLALTIVPSVLVFIQGLTLEDHKQFMIFGMLMWFFSTPFWMKEQKL